MEVEAYQDAPIQQDDRIKKPQVVHKRNQSEDNGGIRPRT